MRGHLVEKKGTIEPTQRIVLWDAVTVDLFGAKRDWRTRFAVSELSKPEAARDREIMRNIGTLVDPAHVSKIIMPLSRTANAIVTDMNAPGWIEVKPNKSTQRIYRGVKADGVELLAMQAAFINSGGCPTIIVYDKTSARIIVAHVGRESLYDKGYVDGNSKTAGRAHESVVYAALDKLETARMKNIYVFITCGIAGKHFSHPTSHPVHGQRNQRMLAYAKKKWGESFLLDPPERGCISLHDWIIAQCLERGVPRKNITRDLIDTFGDTNAYGRPIWHDHRRDSVIMDEEQTGRNGVLVYRTP